MYMKKRKFILIVISFGIFFSCLLLVLNYPTKKYKTNILNKDYIYELNKIIIVGDSRMELIENNKDKMNLPKSIIFDAKSGAKIDWLYREGIPKLYKILKNQNYNYHVVFNLGVNDMDSNISIKNIVNQYYKTYKRIITNNEQTNFYILSVNPIDENKIYNLFNKNSKRTTKKIELFNKEMIKLIKKDNIKNIKFCNSYNSIDFEMPDGLHYNYKTDEKIMKYIIEKCVKY